MATRSLATDISAPAPTGLREEDYRTFCAALESTQRGRDFLAEYARRNRNADTEMLLDSLDRIESMMQAEGKARDRLRDELRVLLIAIRLARPDINSATALTKAARLVDLLDLMEKRIDDMVEDKNLAPIEEEPLPQFAPAALAVVPRPDEPELPIPTVTSLQGPVIALVQEPTRVVIKPLVPEIPAQAIQELAIQQIAKQEVPKQEAPKAETPKQELPQSTVQQAQEMQPHEWAQLEILNRPRPSTNIAAVPYELWETIAEAAPAPQSAPALTAPVPARTKWLPDFGGETQIIHTKPVTAVAFMPEVTFMGAAARAAANETKAQPETKAKAETKAETKAATKAEVKVEAKAVVKAEVKAEQAVVEAAASPVVSAAAAPVAAPPAETPASPPSAPVAKTVPPRNDPLAAIMALSEAERIALFT